MLKTQFFEIRDWIRGKERNIRALMSSLNEVLWEEAKANWIPPTISDLLNDSQQVAFWNTEYCGRIFITLQGKLQF
jgi:hypothetical protein